MSGSEVYRTVGGARFVQPRGGRAHVRPTHSAPATSCGRPIGRLWAEVHGPRADVCGWCITTCQSDERSGFQRRVVKVAEEAIDVR